MSSLDFNSIEHIYEEETSVEKCRNSKKKKILQDLKEECQKFLYNTKIHHIVD